MTRSPWLPFFVWKGLFILGLFAGTKAWSAEIDSREAEAGSLGNGAAQTPVANASGGAGVSGLDHAGAYAQWADVEGGAGGACVFQIVYACASPASAVMSVYANGTRTHRLTFPVTGSPGTFATLTDTIPLYPGRANTIKIQHDPADTGAQIVLDRVAILDPVRENPDVFQFMIRTPDYAAWLWIPPKAPFVRGVVVDKYNLLDPAIVTDASIRKICAEEKLAIAYIMALNANAPMLNLMNFAYTAGAGDTLLNILSGLAKASGYQEVAHAPIMTIGHSAQAGFAWRPAYWDKSRVFAEVSIKAIQLGGYNGDNMDGVPVLHMVGDYDEWQIKDYDTYGWKFTQTDLGLRGNGANLVATVVEWGGGHFEFSQDAGKLVALFIKKAAQARIPNAAAMTNPVTLLHINANSGWLNSAYYDNSRSWEPKPTGQYDGDAKKAFWYFDQEYAFGCRNFTLESKGGKRQMAAFLTNGQPSPQYSATASAGAIGPLDNLIPEADGVTFRIPMAFRQSIPDYLAPNGGMALEHGSAAPNFRVIDGPLIKLSEDRFRIAYNITAYYKWETWLDAYAPTDGVFGYMQQPATLDIPKNTSGASQTIAFGNLPDITGNAGEITLDGRSSAGAQVGYFILKGPAVIRDGNKLSLTQIPSRSKFPLEVTVVAYQWGRNTAPRMQTAAPVERTFRILTPTSIRPVAALPRLQGMAVKRTGRTLSVSFSLSQPARIGQSILGLTGRMEYDLGTIAYPQGWRTVAWDAGIFRKGNHILALKIGGQTFRKVFTLD